MNAYLTLSLLFLLFALIHSITAANFFKRRIEAVFGLKGAKYRLLYSALSFPSALPFTAYWLAERGQTPILIAFSGWAKVVVLMVKLTGAAILTLSLLQTGAAEFLGLKPERRKLVTSGLYSRVRHPMYLGAVIFIWASPELRYLDILLYTLATLYFAFGIYIEERRLLESFGSEYESYRSRVPAILPRLR